MIDYPNRALAARCTALAGAVRAHSWDLARKCAREVGRVLQHTDTEFCTLSESAVFLAFVELGGDPDQPDAFAWDAQRDALVRTASRHLRRDLRGKGSDVFEARRERNRSYAAVACIERFRWDAWSAIHTNPNHPRGPRLAEPLDHETPTERDAIADALAGLAEVLRPLLTPMEWYCLEQHYLLGRSQRDLAAELASREPTRYRGDTGLRNARSRVGMIVMRARDKACEKLDGAWRERARQVAAR